MHLAQQIEPHIHADSAADTVTLDYESRFLRRKRLVTDNGEAFLVELAETCSIDEGQGFRLDDGRVIAVRAAAEQLLADGARCVEDELMERALECFATGLRQELLGNH